MNDEVRVLGAREDLRQVTAPTPVRLERPPEEAVAREELVSESLAIAGARPELFAASAATDGPSKQPKEYRSERWVEPDHGVRARPHEIARAATRVIAVDDPRVAFGCASDALLEDSLGDQFPVRTPGERVELDVRNAEPTR